MLHARASSIGGLCVGSVQLTLALEPESRHIAFRTDLVRQGGKTDSGTWTRPAIATLEFWALKLTKTSPMTSITSFWCDCDQMEEGDGESAIDAVPTLRGDISDVNRRNIISIRNTAETLRTATHSWRHSIVDWCIRPKYCICAKYRSILPTLPWASKWPR